MRTLCVFCGSASGRDPSHTAVTADLGRLLAARRIALVYGGARVGLMGTLADAVLAGGGRVTGVIPRSLVEREVAHDGLTDLRVVGSMHERKALMASLADAFLALPGGLGTLEELFEVLTWAQLGLHDQPCALLDIGGYYRSLLEFLDRAVAEGYIRGRHRSLLLVDDDPEHLLDSLTARVRPGPPRPLTPDET